MSDSTTAILVACLGLATGVISLVWQQVTSRQLERFKAELTAAEAHAERFRLLRAQAEPLRRSLDSLDGRITNILERHFLEKYRERDPNYAAYSTVFAIGELFARIEIFRRQTEYRLMADEGTVHELDVALGEIGRAFSSDRRVSDDAGALALWRYEQQALGESLIITRDGLETCMGYGDFYALLDSQRTSPWVGRLSGEIHTLLDLDPGHVGLERLRYVQMAVVDAKAALGAAESDL